MDSHQPQAGYNLPCPPYTDPYHNYFRTQTDVQHGVETHNCGCHLNQVDPMQLQYLHPQQDIQSDSGWLYRQNTISQQSGDISNHCVHEGFATGLPDYALNQNPSSDVHLPTSLPDEVDQQYDTFDQTGNPGTDGFSAQNLFNPYFSEISTSNDFVSSNVQYPMQQRHNPCGQLTPDMSTVNEQTFERWNNIGHAGLQMPSTGPSEPLQCLPSGNLQPLAASKSTETYPIHYAPMTNTSSVAAQDVNLRTELMALFETGGPQNYGFGQQPTISHVNTSPASYPYLRLSVSSGFGTGISSDCTTPKSFGDTETTSWTSGQTSLLDPSGQAQNPVTTSFSPHDISTPNSEAFLRVPNRFPESSSTLGGLSNPPVSLSTTPTNAPLYEIKVAEWNDQPPGTESYNSQQVSWNNELSNQVTGGKARSSTSEDRWPRRPTQKALPLRRTNIARLAPKTPQADPGAPGLSHTTTKRMNEVNKLPCKLCKQLKTHGAPNASIPGGRCSMCQRMQDGQSIYRFLRCTPAKIQPLTLYRTDSTQPFWKDLNLKIGPTEVVEGVTSLSDLGFFSLTQGHGVTLSIPLSKVEACSVGQLRLASRYPSMFKLPYLVRPCNLSKFYQNISSFMRDADDAYFAQIIAQGSGGMSYDGLIHGVFARAKRLAQSATEPPTTASAESSLVANCLRFWTTCRFIEGGWTVVEPHKLGLPHANDLHTSVPLLSHQLGATFIGKHLPRLADEIRKGLNKSLNDRHLLMTNFVAIFVLLHNFSMIMAHQTRFSRARKSKFRYTNMPLIRGLHESAKILLTHFHIMSHRQPIFDLDWKPPGGKVKMPPFRPEEEDFRKQLAKGLKNRGQYIRDLTLTDQYHEPLWFAAQLFNSKWSERDTPSDSPPMKTDFIGLPIGPARPQSFSDTMET